eukprot:ANDGO_00749.mRNA.1 E3 ubiquitin ligase complex SCF subunit sconC
MSQKIVLTTSDGKSFETTRKACLMSELLRGLLEELPEDGEVEPIPVTEVASSVLPRIISFMEYHADNPMPEIEKPLRTTVDDVVGDFDREFVNVDDETLFRTVLGANYLTIDPLLDLTCAKIATLLKNKTPEEIRQRFNIENDFSPEEEARLREEYRWAFQS